MGDMVLLNNLKVGVRFERSFIRTRSLVQLKEPLTLGFWILRPRKEPTWVSVKYERLQHFCFSCRRIDHDGRECKDAPDREATENRGFVFSNWLCTQGVQTVEEVLVVCRKDWCKVPLLSSKAPDVKPRRSWSLGKKECSDGSSENKDSFGGMSDFRVGSCQNKSQPRKEIICHNISLMGQDNLVSGSNLYPRLTLKRLPVPADSDISLGSRPRKGLEFLVDQLAGRILNTGSPLGLGHVICSSSTGPVASLASHDGMLPCPHQSFVCAEIGEFPIGDMGQCSSISAGPESGQALLAGKPLSPDQVNPRVKLGGRLPLR